MLRVKRKVFSSFLNLLYPPLCFACEQALGSGKNLLCLNCQSLMQVVDPSERCPLCFSQNYSIETQRCSECTDRIPKFRGVASAFDYIGPPATLLKKYKYSNQPFLAQGLAAYLALQFLQLDWPLPDFIVPVPSPIVKQWSRGFSQTLLLAQELANILKVPVLDALIRESGDYSQAGLNRDQRKMLQGKSIRLNVQNVLQGKTILLIDDVYTTGTTLSCCAQVLNQSFPSSLYALTVCRAII